MNFTQQDFIMGPTWGGFVKWAADNGFTAKKSLGTMTFRERTEFADLHHPRYVDDLNAARKIKAKNIFLLESEWNHFLNRMAQN